MTNSFVVEIIVKEVHGLPVTKYLGAPAEKSVGLEDVAPQTTPFGFYQELNKATFFRNYEECNGHLNQLVEECTVPNTGGRTLFGLPISELIGGEHGRRTVDITLNLISLSGASLSTTAIGVLKTHKLVAEEFNGRPYSVTRLTQVKMLIANNHIGEYNVTPPVMQTEHEYHGTYIDTANDKVIHQAYDADGHMVEYVCTKAGNVVHVTPAAA